MFYTTNAYPETDIDDEKLGLTIKGASEEFKVAHSKIALLVSKKGEEVEIDNIKLKTIDNPHEKGCVKAIVEVTKSEIIKGKAVLKIWNPSKKGGTIQITRSKGDSYECVETLQEAIVALLEDSRTDSNQYFKEKLVHASKTGEGNLAKRLKTPKQIEVDGLSITKKAYKCDECSIVRATKKTLNNHKEKKHKGSLHGPEVKILRFKCEHCGIEQPSSRMLKNHQNEIHIGFNQLAGAKRTTDNNIESNEKDETSPVKKKKKCEKQDKVDVTEEMDYDELSTSLGNFVFSKESKSESKKVDFDILELSKRQDELVLIKRKLADEEELKEFERRKEVEEK